MRMFCEGICERRVDSCSWKSLKEESGRRKGVFERVLDGLWGLFVRIEFSVGLHNI
jgi:hypothetical protein